jgi:hypothetical protein
MNARYTWGLSLAAALTMAAGLGAQAPSGSGQATTDDSRTPSTTQTTQTQGDSASDDARSQAGSEREGMVTVTGCIQKERDVLDTRGMGVGDEFVLANVGKDSKDSHAASAAGATAAAEHSAHGGMYTLTGDKEDDLESMVGKRVEIVGRLEHQGDDMAGGATAANTSAAGGGPSDATSDANQPAGTSGDDQAVGTSGAADDSDDTTARATNTGSTLAEDPAYEGSRSPDEREGIQARRRAEALPRIDIESFREVGGDCEAPAQR